MSTATKPSSRNLVQDRQRVRSPLQALRGYIRSYVTLEGAALCGLYLTMWFWIGMILDYGVFRAMSIDWVEVLPWGIRAGVLVILTSGLIATGAFVVLRRFLREFSDAAVAIVLERRFPKLLGDRLITAVELSDPQQAAAYGYSAAMVRETIHEAADRVAKVPVREVFDWKRLWMRGLLVLLTSVGIYLVCLLGVGAVRMLTSGPKSPQGSLSQLNMVSTLWVERNILLRNVMWPRRTHLEVINYTDKQRFPKEKSLPALRVRAWKYVIADRGIPEGWRLLTWDDVTARPELFGDAVEAPSDWARRDPNRGLTADEVELWLERFPVRRRKNGEDLPAKWTLPESTIGTEGEEATVKHQPLRWADLNSDRLGDFSVPRLPPGEWDPASYPVQAASVVGLLMTRPLLAPVMGAPGPALTWVVAGPHTINMTVDIAEERIPLRQKMLAAATKKARAEREKLAKELITTKASPHTLIADEAKAAAAGKKIDEAVKQWAAEPDRLAVRRKVESALREAKARKGAADSYALLWTSENMRLAEETFRDLRRQTEQVAAVQSVFTRLTRYIELRGVMDTVVERMGQAEHSRLLRQLELPEQLTLYFSGKKTDNEATMGRTSNNEYTGNFGALEESVAFRVRGGDFTTPWQDIVIVENPAVDRLQSDEERAAYVHYRVLDGKASDLRGLRQAFQEVLLSVSGTDASSAEVLSGSSLTLTATTNKPIKSATLNTILKIGADRKQKLTVWGWRREMKKVALRGLEEGTTVAGVKASVAEGGHGVVLDVDDVGKSQRFKVEYQAVDGTGGSSVVALAPVRDGEKKIIGVDVTYDLDVLEDGKSVAVKIDNVQQELLFTIAFLDEDNVPGSRAIKVVPVRDQAPVIRDFGVDESIRLAKDGYYITAKARVPFRARVHDDLGLAKVRYGYTADRDDLKRKRKEAELNIRLGSGYVPVQGPATFWASLAALTAPYDLKLTPEYVPLPQFEQTIRSRILPADGRPEFLTLETIKKELKKKQREPWRVLLRTFNFEPDDWTRGEPDEPRLWFEAGVRPVGHDLLASALNYYDREEKRLKPVLEKDDRKAQPRYEVKVWLEVEDTYAEGERYTEGELRGQPRPNVSRSNETFTFKVVSDNELLSMIGADEEKKRDELRRTYLPLDEKQKEMAALVERLEKRDLDEESLASLAVRAGTLDTETLATAERVAKDVLATYQKLLREMRLNQISKNREYQQLPGKVYDSIVKPLTEICEDRGNFDTTRAAVQRLQVELEDKKRPLQARLVEGEKKARVAQTEMQTLVRKLNEVLSAMQGLSDINDLINILVAIERAEEAQAKVVEEELNKRIRDLLGEKK